MDHLLHELEEGIGKNTSIIGTGIHSTFSSTISSTPTSLATGPIMPTQETTTSQNPSTSHGHGTSLAPHIITPTTTTGCFTPNPSTLAAGHGTSTSQNPFFHGTGTGQDDRESTPHQRAEPSVFGHGHRESTFNKLMEFITYYKGMYGRLIIFVSLGVGCTVWYNFLPGVGVPEAE